MTGNQGFRVDPRVLCLANADAVLSANAPIIKHQRQLSTDSAGLSSIVLRADGRYKVPYGLLAGCGPLRVGEALGLEIGKHISEDCRTVYIRQKAKRGEIQSYIKTPNGERDVDLCTTLAAMLKDFIGTRTSGVLFCTSTGAQPLQSNTLQDSLHPILKKLGLVTSPAPSSS
jgi:hypothetical protein